eukprot:553963_1
MTQPNNTQQYSQTLLKWVKSRLNVLIGADDFAPLLLSANDRDLEDYCNQILATQHPQTTIQSFINQLIAKRNQETKHKNQHKNQPKNQPKNTNTRSSNRRARNNRNKNQNNNKPNNTNTMRLDANKHINISKKPTITNKKISKPKPQQTSYRESKSMTITHAPISKKQTRLQSKKKQKQKRTVCGCQATIHDVFKNCTQCGNILCAIEGEGPCFYCSSFVTLAGSIPNINNSANTFEHRKSKQYIAAVAQKDKLLKFGRDKISQTTIIDDQGDFYENEANNLWLTQREREIAKQKAIQQENKLNESRADRSIEISIGFDGINDITDERKKYIFDSIDRQKELEEKRKKELNEMDYGPCGSGTMGKQNSFYHNSSLTGNASKIYASLQKMIDDEKTEREIKNLKNNNFQKKNENDKLNAVNDLKNKFMEEANSDIDMEANAMEYLSRKQNKNVRKKLRKKSKYSNGSDKGVCLSMHQPWASLLVLGIKKVEGRSWDTKYRGRLWIASARREPTPFEIDEVEKQYCSVYGLNKNEIPFPKEYPTTALLGCVDMIGCLTNDEYQKKYIINGLSSENNSSPYCFICENP